MYDCPAIIMSAKGVTVACRQIRRLLFYCFARHQIFTSLHWKRRNNERPIVNAPSCSQNNSVRCLVLHFISSVRSFEQRLKCILNFILYFPDLQTVHCPIEIEEDPLKACHADIVCFKVISKQVEPVL